METHRTEPSGREIAERGWNSRLAAAVTSLLAVQALTGLWIYLAPFSVAGEIQILLHTLVGIGFAVPYAWYQVRHLADWWGQRMTASMVLGYALGAAVLTCVVSGFVLTWLSAFGPRLSPTWDLVHLVSGLATVALLPSHLVAVFLRRRGVARPGTELAKGHRAFGLRAAAWIGGCAAAVAAGTAFAPEKPVAVPPPADYSMPQYAEEYDAYRDNPFAPSNARTSHKMLVEPSMLAGSASCGTSGCHEQIVDEWEPSAHRFAAMNEPFQTVQRNFAADREPAETRYCAGCHDPISLFAGAKDIANLDLSAPGMQEGISCVGCHSISAADTQGNADYELTPPQKYLWENTQGWRKWVSDFLIRAYPLQHLEDYDRNILRTPEFCAACHKQFIPEALNRFGLVAGQNQYDEWLNAHWHTDNPETDLTCRDCHMRLVDSTDPGRGEGGDVRRTSEDRKHRHHGFIATNNFMPEVLKLPHWEQHVRLTEEWVRGETVLPEIDHLWPRGPVASVEIADLPESAAPGETVALRVVVTNQKAGHNFVTGPLDFVRSWVHLTAVDGSGRVLGEWGAIDPATRRIANRPGVLHDANTPDAEGTMVLEANPIDEDGNLLEKHELWRAAGARSKRVVFPRYADSHDYRLVLPDDVVGPVTLKAELNYRRYRQKFLELTVPEMENRSGVRQNTITQSTAEASLPVTRSEGR